MCINCNNDFAVHKDWNNPPKKCGPCTLISRSFVDAIEYIIKDDISQIAMKTKLVLTKLVKDAGVLYKKRLADGEDQHIAWRSTERELAETVWYNKDLRSPVIDIINELKIQKRGDKLAEWNNQRRTTQFATRTRRWS